MKIEKMKMVDSLELIDDRGIFLSYIKINNSDVVLYGAGEAAYSVKRQLEIWDITPIVIVDNDVNKAGKKWDNISIVHTTELKNHVVDPDNTVAIVAVDAYMNDEDVKNSIDHILVSSGINKIEYMPFWRGISKEREEYFFSHKNEIQWVYDIAADKESKDTLQEWIRMHLQGDLYLLPEHSFRYKYMGCDLEGHDELYRHLENEVFVNCGSCLGDTILLYLAMGYSFDEIHAYEGDLNNYRKLLTNLNGLKEEYKKKIITHNEYIGVGEAGFDEQFKGKRVTLINADIEGLELDVLKGMKHIIKEQEPVIAFCIYHKPSDIVEIPKFIKEVNPNYNIYIRKYVFDHRRSCELVMYAIPKSRCLKEHK